MTKYLKHFLLVLSFLVVSMNFASKAMDDKDDALRHRISIHQNVEALEEGQPAIHSTPTLSVALDEKPTSLASSVFAVAKRIGQDSVKGIGDVLNVAVRHPGPAIVAGLFYLTHATAASCMCWCMTSGPNYKLGCYPSASFCATSCENFNWKYFSCNDGCS